MLVTFLPINKKIQVETDTNLMDIALEHGIDLGGICSRRRTCGKCKVMITKGNNKKYSDEELQLLTEEEQSSGIRLACCFTIIEDTCIILSGRRKNTTELDHCFEKLDSSQEELDEKLETGPANHYGIAFDIGTTSVVGRLWDLDHKEMVGEISTKNPQSIYGADVIARITYANQSPEHLKRLTDQIRECCNTLLLQLTSKHNINKDHIESAVIVANTTMTQLFLGNSVEKLARVPFQGISYEGIERKAFELDLQMSPEGIVYIMPGIAGHVGSDTLGCILARDLQHAKGNRLLVDIGTNGEIALSKDGELIVCSTAAGPAFEGASLHQGMRAINGAISKVKIGKEGIELEVVGGDTQPVGICGSGVIEAVSELLSNGIMDETGRLLGEAGEKNYFTLWKKEKEEVILTQKDIRELQLAKGAIYTGILLLLREVGLRIDQIDGIDLAGAFGSNIDLRKAIHIGLLPAVELDRIQYIGNGALDGASKVLLGEVSKRDVEEIGKKIKHLELALCEDFQEEFLKAMSF